MSPKGRYVSFVRDANLHVIDLATGKENALTTDGKDPVSWGTAEFAAQEEMERYTGYWWSPDETRIALTHVDEGVVDIIPRLEVSAEGLTSIDQRYPRAGRPNAIVQLHVEDVGSHRRVKMDLGADTDFYLARVAWAKDGSALYAQRLSARPEEARSPKLRSAQRRLPHDPERNLAALGRALERFQAAAIGRFPVVVASVRVIAISIFTPRTAR